jgi:amino acid permease
MSILLPTFKNQPLFTSTIQIEEPSSSHDNNEDLIKPAKQFHFWSTLGIAYSFTSTPLAVGTYLSLTVGIGGSPFFIFAYLLSVCMNMCICLSLAELAAVMPHCGGPSPHPHHPTHFLKLEEKKTHKTSQVKSSGPPN